MKELETSSTNSSNGQEMEDYYKEHAKTGSIQELYKGKELNSNINFDYNKGLFWQMLFTNWTYEEYT